MGPQETTRRIQRMNKRVQQALGEAILRSTNNPLFKVVSITAVETSKDYKNAKVLFSCMDESLAEQTKIALSRSEAFFRQKITEAVDLPYTPRLKFVYDVSLAQSQKLLSLMDAVQKERVVAEGMPEIKKTEADEAEDEEEFDEDDEFYDEEEEADPNGT